MKEIIFHSNNRKLSAVIFSPLLKQSQSPAILFVHGWTSNKTRSYQYAESLSQQGYLCFLFDMSGHGESDGDRMLLTNKDFLDDVVTAYDVLSKIEGVEKNNISAVGSSFGGYLVALLSSKKTLKNIVLRVPADYPNELFTSPKEISSGGNPNIMKWRKERRTYHESFALEAIHNFDGNILIIESELDEQVPHETLENYVNAVKDKSKLTHIVMKGASHSIKEGPLKDEVNKIKLDWFIKIGSK